MNDDFIDSLTPRVPFEIDHDHGSVRFYWGVASGGSHAALSRTHADASVPGPERVMVSATTAMNGLWEGPRWMVDCGGSPDAIKANGGHKMSPQEYLEYLCDPPTKYGSDPDDVEIEQFALRDWPCEPEVRHALGCSVKELQRRTLVDHIDMIDAVDDIDAQPVAVLQGWTAQDYLECLDMYVDHGLVTDVLGIGSVCRRAAVDEIKDVVHRIRKATSPRVDLHGFGVKRNMLESPEALTVFDSVDSAAWENHIYYDATRDQKVGPPGGTCDDWVDFDDDGKARYTWRNIQINYEAYRERVVGLKPKSVERNVRFVDISGWGSAYRGLDGDGDRYPLVKCVCGTVLDPGAPDPCPEPGCRHCERSALNLWDRHLMAREDTMCEQTEHDQ